MVVTCSLDRRTTLIQMFTLGAAVLDHVAPAPSPAAGTVTLSGAFGEELIFEPGLRIAYLRPGLLPGHRPAAPTMRGALPRLYVGQAVADVAADPHPRWRLAPLVPSVDRLDWDAFAFGQLFRAEVLLAVVIEHVLPSLAKSG